MSTVDQHNPVLLLILDGWGYANTTTEKNNDNDTNTKSNAVVSAKTPVLDSLQSQYYCTLLEAHGKAVGLPKDAMGNSEVGHLTIGAGRIIPQYRTRIDKSIAEHTFESHKALKEALQYSSKHSHRLHLIGLLSDGGVHSHQNHLYELLKIAKKSHIPHIYIHAILDGRDTPPNSAMKYINDLLKFLDKEQVGALADVVGRHYAMDRDKKWERTERAMKLYLRDEGQTEEHVATEQLDEILESHYKDGMNDQQIPPYATHSEGNVKDGDTVLFFNFRNDRMRQLTEAFIGKHQFQDSDLKLPKDLYVISMVPYDESYNIPVIFDQEDVPMTLPEVIAKQSLHQFHCAETEKYAHVTYFFAGMKEQTFPLEKRKLVPSPKVETYDKAPEMSSKGVAEEVVKALREGKFTFILANFAPMDMVAHTGNFDATVNACEAVDKAIKQIIEAVKEINSQQKNTPWIVCITGDHGNAEQMIQDGQKMTSHTTNPVRFIVVGDKYKAKDENTKLKITGGLQDIAPTVLSLLGIQKPQEMSGHSLVGLHA